jgi:mandelate racemase
MSHTRLTLTSVRARPVLLKLKRPVVARIATITEWPVILIDLFTEEGVVGRSYLEPYVVNSMKYLVAALHDLGDTLQGRTLSPIELYAIARNYVEPTIMRSPPRVAPAIPRQGMAQQAA